MLDMAKHTLAEQMAKLKEKQEKERDALQATTERMLIQRFRQETRGEANKDSDELESADTDGGWPALGGQAPQLPATKGPDPCYWVE